VAREEETAFTAQGSLAEAVSALAILHLMRFMMAETSGLPTNHLKLTIRTAVATGWWNFGTR